MTRRTGSARREKPKVQATAIDAVVIALSPALIIGMIACLIFFLVVAFYQGQYDVRLMYILGLYTMATVLIARIAIDQGRTYANAFSLPLAIVSLLAMLRFVTVSGPLGPISWLVNIGLLALAWYLADRITFDCTAVDDRQASIQQGLLQTLGLLQPDRPRPPAARASVSNAPAASAQKKHNPGVWVLYFALLAFPLFGLGQLAISDTQQRQQAFYFLFGYLAFALCLLVTTSFVGMRRYLRQKGISMPTEMSRTWLGVGVVGVLVILVACLILPLPGRSGGLVGLPIQFTSPESLSVSRFGWGQEGSQNPSNRPSAGTQSETGPQLDATEQEGQGAPQEDEQAGNNGGRQTSKEGENGSSANSQPNNSQPNNSQPNNSQPNNSQPNNSQPNNSQPNNSQPNNSQPNNSQPNNSQPNNSQSPNSQSPNSQSPNSQSPNSQSPNSQSPNSQSPNSQSPNSQSPNSQSPNSQSPNSQSPNSQSPNSQSPNSQSPNSQSPNSQRSPTPPEEQPQSDSEPGQGRNAENNNDQPEPSSRASAKEPAGGQQDPQPDRAKRDEEDSDGKQSASDSGAANAPPPPPAQPNGQAVGQGLSQWLPSLDGSLASLIKWLTMIVLAAIVVIYAVTHPAEVARLWRQMCDLLANLFGSKRTASPTAAERAVAIGDASHKSRKPFSSFANPFASQLQGWTPAQVIEHTFAAFEAWADERGSTRANDQTAVEFARQVARKTPAVGPPALAAANMLDQLMFAGREPKTDELRALEKLWRLLRQEG